MKNGKKRVYVGFLGFSLLIVVMVALFLSYIFTYQNVMLSELFIFILRASAIFIFILLALGILGIVLMLLKDEYLPRLDIAGRFTSNILFPLAVFMAKVLGIGKEKLLSSYIEVNNKLTCCKKYNFTGKQIMLLLPHCLQNSECPHKITVDINNCKRCGKCVIGNILELSEKYHINVKVATGGTLARKFIRDINPQGVVAVACERDLSAGINDMSGVLPVIGVLNQRPNGPCVNTTVDIQALELAIQKYLKEDVI